MVSNLGAWIHSVGAGWLMTSLSPSPFIISLVQTVTTLPIFLFGLPAGALADIFDRRILLLITNGLMLVTAGVFAVMVWMDLVTAESLLLITFLLGTGAAFMAPAWQAVIPKTVPREVMPQAVALGGISINISRAIGPAVAGVLISIYGIVSPFVANTLLFIIIVLALLYWKNKSAARQTVLPMEKVTTAMKTGIRYAIHSQPLRITIWHVLGYMFFGNAFWGLLPFIAKNRLGGDAGFYGLLIGAVGVAAVVGALLLPRLTLRWTANQLVAAGSIGTSIVTGYFAFAGSQLLAIVAGFVFGFSWILILTTVNVSAQQALPDWVRGRGLAIYMMALFGSMSIGAAFWGWLAGQATFEISMLAAAIGGILFAGVSYRHNLQSAAHIDHSPSHHWPAPVHQSHISHDAGPVLVQICYQIEDRDRPGFLREIYKLGKARKRNGASGWGVFEDGQHKGRFIEQFMEKNWVEHLRHHDRMTLADKAVQEAVLRFHGGAEPPQVFHLVAAGRSGSGDPDS